MVASRLYFLRANWVVASHTLHVGNQQEGVNLDSWETKRIQKRNANMVVSGPCFLRASWRVAEHFIGGEDSVRCHKVDLLERPSAKTCFYLSNFLTTRHQLWLVASMNDITTKRLPVPWLYRVFASIGATGWLRNTLRVNMISCLVAQSGSLREVMPLPEEDSADTQLHLPATVLCKKDNTCIYIYIYIYINT